LLDKAEARMETGPAELQRRKDSNDLARMDDPNTALATLEIERAALERVPTWPWERGTVRSLVAALPLPGRCGCCSFSWAGRWAIESAAQARSNACFALA
jgi:hypothetical protein